MKRFLSLMFILVLILSYVPVASAADVVNVKGGTFIDRRPLEQLMEELDDVDASYLGVFAYSRKIYFKKGKLTVDVYFYNRLGRSVKKVHSFKMQLYDVAAGKVISKYSKSTVRSSKLKNGAGFKFSYSFPRKNLDKRYDLTQLGEDGLPSQFKIDGRFIYDE